MQNDNQTDRALRRALFTMRIIWFALLMGPISFMFVIVWGPKPAVRPPPQTSATLLFVTAVLFFTAIPIGFVIRWFIFRRSAVDGRVPRPSYSTGNIIFWAMCEMVAFIGLMAVFLSGSFWPAILFVGGALGFQAISVPLGGKLSVNGGAGPL